nr:F-box domain, leucine-rich repeat domain, L domain-like protein [Tanacetum cinerariifolium]
EMRRLEAMGTYTDDEINRLARGGKQRGHIAGVGRVLPARATASLIWMKGLDGRWMEGMDGRSGRRTKPDNIGGTARHIVHQGSLDCESCSVLTSGAPFNQATFILLGKNVSSTTV